MVQECSLWAISGGHIVEFIDPRGAFVPVVSLDNVCFEEPKNNIGRPGAVNDAFTNRRPVDAYVVKVADGSPWQFSYFEWMIAGGLKQSWSHGIEPAVKRFFESRRPSLRRGNASRR